MKLEHSLTPKKHKLKWVKGLNIGQSAIKLEEIIGRALFDINHINHRNVFWNPSSKPKEIKAKINKWDLMKPRSLCTAKKTSTKQKDKLLKERKFQYLQMI